MKIKLIIAGGRTFDNYNFLKESVSEYLATLDYNEIQIVSGGAKGVDTLGERFANENNFDLIVFKADWSKFGRTAGPRRNAEMADYATHLISFWDGQSKGTKSMINLAKKKELFVQIVSID